MDCHHTYGYEYEVIKLFFLIFSWSHDVYIVYLIFDVPS